jgi:hypothetical protein
MICAFVPATVGNGHGSGAGCEDGGDAAPRPAPPEVALAVGVDVDVHAGALGWVAPPGLGWVLPPGPGWVLTPRVGWMLPPACVPPAGTDPPPVFAVALEALASANAAKLGTIRWATRKRSLSWACGVS